MHFTCIIHIHVYNESCSVFLKKKYSNRKLLKKRYEEKIDAVENVGVKAWISERS